MRVDINNSNRLAKTIKTLTGESLVNPINGITTDSRNCKSGDLYIALTGIRSDGHQYIYDVERKRFDHHQAEYKGSLSSVYKHIAKKIGSRDINFTLLRA